ncbi:MAG: uracil-DNA glycosylase [Pseudomonadota bacterium]
MAASARTTAEPPADCALCPRLKAFRETNRAAFPDYFNAPAPTFAAPSPSLLIVGLAPGLHGANKTGRPFTGDYAGDLLYETLAGFSFSNDQYAAAPDDGLELIDAAITNAVRCVPPQNKPTASEINTCRPYLKAQIDALPELRAILCLGLISHKSTIAALGLRQKDAAFSHRARHEIPERPFSLFDSYHCSRYNTNTGRLTKEMFDAVFADIRRHLDAA